MTEHAGHPDVEVCGLCESDKIRLRSGAIVCATCDLIFRKVSA